MNGSAAAAASESSRTDRGSLTIVAVLLTVVCLAGGALIVDGGRALAARRHAANTAEAAARFAVATQSLEGPPDSSILRDRAVEFAGRAGVPSSDVTVSVLDAGDGPTVVVTITERASTVFLALGGSSSMTVHATGTARFVYST